MMKLLSVISLFVAAVSLCLSISLLQNQHQGPFFIDSKAALSVDPDMLSVNQRIALQDEELKKNEQIYNDSIAKLFDSLSVRRGEEEALVDLMNLESNVYRHKKVDSISRVTQAELAVALDLFNGKIKVFCEKRGIPVLFASNNNTVVYGTGEKADLTNEYINFYGSKK
ncbi:MAG: hypothetical protein IK102_07825 [Treponema sp.]|nr:hypothetical protein [Treponema sp.]